MGSLSNRPTRREIRAPVNTSFFGDMLQSIAERGRALIERTRDRREVAEQRSASLVQLCEDLLSGRGEASGVALAREILARYGELNTGPAHRLLRGAGEPVRARPRPAQRRRHGLAAAAPSDAAAVQAASRLRAAAARAVPAPQSRARTGPRRWCACASSCSTPWIIATISRSSTTISSTCSRPGSTAASWCCGRSTGRRRRTCWRRSSATRRCMRSATGTTCARASIRPTGAAMPSSIRRWSTSR